MRLNKLVRTKHICFAGLLSNRRKKIQNVNLKCILSNQVSPGKLLLPFSKNILLSIALQRTEYGTSLCGLVPQTPPYILHLHICKAHTASSKKSNHCCKDFYFRYFFPAIFLTQANLKACFSYQ